MERLTYKTQDGWVGVNEQEDKTVSPTSVAIHKLCELEDVLEEFELTSAEDLRNYLNFKTNMAIWEGELNYKNKIAELEQELAELKQSQKQLAIEELEKLKATDFKKIIFYSFTPSTHIENLIDNQIKELKGEE